jgi:hypothetical protein
MTSATNEDRWQVKKRKVAENAIVQQRRADQHCDETKAANEWRAGIVQFVPTWTIHDSKMAGERDTESDGHTRDQQTRAKYNSQLHDYLRNQNAARCILTG